MFGGIGGELGRLGGELGIDEGVRRMGISDHQETVMNGIHLTLVLLSFFCNVTEALIG